MISSLSAEVAAAPLWAVQSRFSSKHRVLGCRYFHKIRFYTLRVYSVFFPYSCPPSPCDEASAAVLQLTECFIWFNRKCNDLLSLSFCVCLGPYFSFLHTASKPVDAHFREPHSNKQKSAVVFLLFKKTNFTSLAVLPHSSVHVFHCRNDLLLLTLIGWIKINSPHEQQGFINHTAT